MNIAISDSGIFSENFQKMKDGKYKLCVNGQNIEFTANEGFKMVKLNVMT